MVDMKKSPERESGQSHIVAMCIALPLFFVAMFFLAQICWVGYQALSFDHALYQSAWTVSQDELDEMSASGDASRYVHDAIIADWTQINPDDLTIDNAACVATPKTAAKTLTSASDIEGMRIERAVQTITTARITATATLRVKPLFPVAGIDPDFSLVRAIDKTQQVSSRFEVS